MIHAAGFVSNIPNSNPQASSASSLSHIVQIAFAAIESAANSFSDFVTTVQDGLLDHHITSTSMRYAFYGVRIPFIYLEYFIHDAVNDSVTAIIGNVLYLFAEMGNLAQWLHHLEIIDLSKISSGMGQTTVLGSFGICPIDAGLSILSGIASVFYCMDYMTQLARGNLSRQEKIAVWLGLTSCVIHIIAIVIFFASGGGLTPVVMGLTVTSTLIYVGYWILHRYPLKCLSET